MENEQTNNKGSKTLTYVIVGVIVAALIGGGIFLLTRNKGESGNTENSGAESSEEEGTSTYSVTPAELSGTKDVTIAYGDFEAMKTLASGIQNGEMTGKTVEIDGIVSHPGLSFSVTEASSDGTSKIGTVFIIQDEPAYPDDGAHIKISAKVVEVSPMNFQLVTLKDFIEVK